MNTRYTLITLLVAVALGSFAWLQREVEPTDFTDGGPTPTPAPLFELAAEDIQEVEVKSPAGDYTVTRVAGGWEIDQQALADYVGSTIEGLAKPSVLRYLPEDRKPEEFGFDSPTMTVTLKTAAGESKTIVVGDKNPVEPQYYIRLGDDPRIAIVSSGDWESLQSWTSAPPYAPTQTPEPSSDGTETEDGDLEDADALMTPSGTEDGAADGGAGDGDNGADEPADEVLDETASAEETPDAAPEPSVTAGADSDG